MLLRRKGKVMEIKRIDGPFSVCKVTDFSSVDWSSPFCFTGKTDEENSLVCMTKDVPPNTTERDDGWTAFRIQGVLDFSLVGILSSVSSLLAENGIAIFAVSTYNTDYILTKAESADRTAELLSAAGYRLL